MTRTSIVAIALAIALAANLTLSTEPVTAHCTNNGGNFYSYADGDLAGGLDALHGTIEWTNPNVCTSSVSHGLDLEEGGTSIAFVQGGWRKKSGWTSPQGYCEMQGPAPANYIIVDYPITASTHHWHLRHVDAGDTWYCRYQGFTKLSRTKAWVGFETGHYVSVQGVAHQQHVQVGRMAPGTLLFANLQYRVLHADWWVLNIVPRPPDVPYGNAEPVAGQFKVWTNAHKDWASWLILGLALAGLLLALTVRDRSSPFGASPDASIAMLDASDAARLGGGVRDTPVVPGIVTVDVARNAILDSYWKAEPSTPRPSVVVYTDKASAEMGLTPDRPVWVLRYDVEGETSPAGVPIPYAYVHVDARSGEYLFTLWAP